MARREKRIELRCVHGGGNLQPASFAVPCKTGTATHFDLCGKCQRKRKRETLLKALGVGPWGIQPIAPRRNSVSQRFQGFTGRKWELRDGMFHDMGYA